MHSLCHSAVLGTLYFSWFSQELTLPFVNENTDENGAGVVLQLPVGEKALGLSDPF